MQEALSLAVVNGIHLPGEQEHARGRELRLEQARHRVRRPGACADDRDAEPARRPRVAIGRVHRALFVTDADGLDRAIAQNRIVDGDVVHAHDAEDMSHADGLERCDHRLAACHFLHLWFLLNRPSVPRT